MKTTTLRPLSVRLLRFFLLVACNLILCAAQGSTDIIPLYSFNQSPVIQIYGLPSLGPAQVLNPDKTDLSFQLQVANNAIETINSNEYLVLDGESHRFTLVVRRGLGQGYEWGFELPYVSHSGGFMDNFIEDWHQTFGLPQGKRPNFPHNQINYRYVRNGSDQFRISSAVDGVGDIRLTAAKDISHDPGERWVALRGSLKLPTGKSADLLGSGSADLAIWLSMAPGTKSVGSVHGYGGGGILMMTEGDVLPNQQRNSVAFGTIGLTYLAFPSLTFTAQLDAHTPFYRDSGFRELKTTAVQGLLGVAWKFAPGKQLDLSISEDLAVDTSPDFAFNLKLSFSF